MHQLMGNDVEFLSHAVVKNRARSLARISTVVHHMCPQGCTAYTGPLSELEDCPTCLTSRWDPLKLQQGTKTAAQSFTTITLGGQLQNLYSTPQGARNMRYRREKTLERLRNDNCAPSSFHDFTDGSDYLKQCQNNKITDNDILLMISLDGAQLYEHRDSDCWMYIWVVLELSPDQRYKKTHVLPGGIIPGPNKPKNVDSFLFPSLYHLAALQKEGLRIWDASTGSIFTSIPKVYLGTADAPGMVYFSGLVGHSGAHGCRNYCDLPWRHKPKTSHYYPVLQLPHDYSSMQSQPFDDLDLSKLSPFFEQAKYDSDLLRVIQATNNFEDIRKETGISKASLFSGLEMPLGVPGSFPLDTMHLLALNIPELLIGLWRGTFRCDKKAGDDTSLWDWAVLKDTKDDKVWTAHGRRVAELSKYLPSSYDRPPRNPAEKLNSGYKASEFIVYLYGYLPALLEDLLPPAYLQNFYYLVRGVRLVSQRGPSFQDLEEAHGCFISFLNGFETLYVQRKVSRMHFARQCLHTLWHLAPETRRLGPPGIYAQWTMERLIGLLGQDLRLHSNPYANLREIAIQRCTVNSLYARYPTMDPTKSTLPHTARPLENNYFLLHPHEVSPFRMQNVLETETFIKYLRHHNLDPSGVVCTRHARLRLPNGQTARTAWKEDQRAESRTNRMVKLKVPRQQFPLFGEVLYFLQIRSNEVVRTCAMISLTSSPCLETLKKTFNVIWVVTF
ncbi:hypothetical protein AGABI2DRAFT_220514, partial [Agaricus bisporus var. bisporus H97]|uniref:hypothetical protein n=1 Tax=Agaricus bisporus var. bisporus (strain H97 / ATCC MYA-4626 / FGSC 10389) TaxID=936046 RepID=UPI00029F5D0A